MASSPGTDERAVQWADYSKRQTQAPPPAPSNKIGMSLRENPIVVKFSRYFALVIVAYYAGVALFTAPWLLAVPATIFAVFVMVNRKVGETWGLARSREGQKSIFFFLFMTGLFSVGTSWLFLYVEANVERVQLVDLADIESGKVTSLPDKVRLVGPIACLYGRGYPAHDNSKDPAQVTGWYFPIASRKHVLFNDPGTRSELPAETFAVYLLADNCPKQGRASLPGIESYAGPEAGTGSDLTSQGPRPRYVLRDNAGGFGQEQPVTDKQFYLACALIVVGLSMFIGLCLMPSPPSRSEALEPSPKPA